MNRPVPRAEIEKFTAALAEKRRRLAKAEHSTRGYRDEDGAWRGGLLSFVRYFWHILEPGTSFVDGWVLEAICLPYETRITTAEGVKSIGDIVETKWRGDVLSLNHATGIIEWKPIVAHMKSAGKTLVTIKAGSANLSLTENHPVYTSERGYVRADQVRVGETLWLHSMSEGVSDSAEPQPILQSEMLARQSLGRSQSQTHTAMQELWGGVLSLSFAPDWRVLLSRLFCSRKDGHFQQYLRKMWLIQKLGRRILSLLPWRAPANRPNVFLHSVRKGNLSLASAICAGFKEIRGVLWAQMLRFGLSRGEEYFVCEWRGDSQIPHRVLVSAPFSFEARETFLFPVLKKGGSGYPSHRSGQVQQRFIESRGSLSRLPLRATRPVHAESRSEGRGEVGAAVVHSISRDSWIPDAVYNIEIEGNNNYFANDILVHNCEHLEAVTFGEITNLLINVPPGFSKSLITNCFWPAWEWGAMELSHIRYVTFSYSSSNTQRDNQRFGDLVASSEFKAMYPAVQLRQNGMEMVSNYKHGWKLASSVTGSATGKRGNRAICFPPDQVVHTERGLIPIGEIVEGRLSLRMPSIDVSTGEVSLQPIIGWHRNPASEVIKITLSDGSSVRCTPNHRFWDGIKWVEASSLQPGTALSVVGLADSFGHIPPSSTNTDTLNGHTLDAIAGSQSVCCVSDVAGDLSDLILGKDSEPARWHEGAVLNRVFNILLSRSVMDVVQSTIKGISVFVADFLSFRTRTDERFRHQFMNQSAECLSILPQVYARVASGGFAFHYFSSIEHFMSAFLMARAVSVNSHSLSSNNSSRDAFNSSYGGYFVKSLKPDDGHPHLFVLSVEDDGHEDHSYCLTVSRNHTFCVGGSKGLIASNCDDLNNVKESESKPVMEETNRWFRESLSSRLNDMEKDAKIVIAQRVGEGDVSGEILRLGLPYCHLMIQMEYVWQADSDGNPYTTQIGWVDPRWRPTAEECEGELAWPERFSEKAVQDLKVELGPFAVAAQLQQTPEARGGGVLKREWWLPGEQYMPDERKFPPFSYLVASLDGAFDEKEINDPSALTIWGIFSNEHGYNRAMLVHAWAKRLQISGIKVEVEPGEHESVYRRRAMPHWGLVEWVADTCNRFKVDRLLIENKASGKPAAQSLQNSHGRQGWAIVLVEPKGDKYARGLAVQPSFSQGMIYAPDRDWAFGDGGVVDECAKFPKGLHDDQYDSTTQAIKHLRDTGLLRSDEDRRAEELDAVRHKGAPKGALYPGFRRRQA
jgi:predicted phage terminase large subunit-like protein